MGRAEMMRSRYGTTQTRSALVFPPESALRSMESPRHEEDEAASEQKEYYGGEDREDDNARAHPRQRHGGATGVARLCAFGERGSASRAG